MARQAAARQQVIDALAIGAQELGSFSDAQIRRDVHCRRSVGEKLSNAHGDHLEPLVGDGKGELAQRFLTA